jgi:hypothetical protein
MRQLDVLKEESYEIEVGPLVSSPVLRRRLKQMPQVAAVREALRDQLITDEDIRSFVGQLILSFNAGRGSPSTSRSHPSP